MRFRRSILASLAPLIGLSALLAAASAEAGVARTAKPLIRLLQSVVQYAAPACDFAVATPSHERPPGSSSVGFHRFGRNAARGFGVDGRPASFHSALHAPPSARPAPLLIPSEITPVALLLGR